ncbi:hypothetical protein ACFQXB_04180 [Plastorhodobacter daqingensis]|uniref:Uncharacterized protein n=1 Tax=Plastorhodobacter daqingensis TaxID=1387281 RepID=A0ABW2UIH6_9RHOB
MARLSIFHNPLGGGSSLGLRKTDSGTTEIIFDDGVARRLVWRVASPGIAEHRLSDALRAAIHQTRVLPALYAELKKRSIAIESVIR